MAEVASSRESLDQAMNDILMPLSEAISQVTDDIKIAEDLLDNTDPKKLLLQYQDWARHIASALDYELPSGAAARRQLALIESMSFQECPACVFCVPELGVIRRQMSERDGHRDHSDSISEPGKQGK